MLALPGPPHTPSASRCSCLLTQLLAHSHIRVMSIVRCTNIPSWRRSASWPPPCAATSAAGCRCWRRTPRTVQQKQTARSAAAAQAQAAQHPQRRLWQQQAAGLQCLTRQLRRPGSTTGASWRRRWMSPGCGGLTPSRLPPTARCALVSRRRVLSVPNGKRCLYSGQRGGGALLKCRQHSPSPLLPSA